jgi:hypothetical protein
MIRVDLSTFYLFSVSKCAGIIGSDLSPDELHASLAVLAVKRVVRRNVDRQTKRV